MSNELTVTNEKWLTADLTGELVTDWLDYEEQEGASLNTITTYRRSINIFAGWLASRGLTVGTVTPADVRQFKADYAKRFSVQTVNLHLTAIRSFYRWAVSDNRALYNPASQIKGAKRPKSKTHKRDALANGEIVGVLRQPDTGTLAGLRDKAMLVLLAYCALRSVELHRANVGDLLTREDRLTLDIQGKGRTKADEYAVIPIAQEPVIREWLKRRLKLGDTAPDAPLFVSLSNRTRGERISLRAIRAMVKDYYAQAGVVNPKGKKTTHSLRHSAITNAIRKGATPMQTQAMARHQSLDTTLGYYHEVGRLDDPAEDRISYDVS